MYKVAFCFNKVHDFFLWKAFEIAHCQTGSCSIKVARSMQVFVWMDFCMRVTFSCWSFECVFSRSSLPAAEQWPQAVNLKEKNRFSGFLKSFNTMFCYGNLEMGEMEILLTVHFHRKFVNVTLRRHAPACIFAFLCFLLFKLLSIKSC